MQTYFDTIIADALGDGYLPTATVNLIETAELPSCFAVSGLATASIQTASVELARVTNSDTVTVDRRLASLWFDMTLRPETWELPSAWDNIAGVYQTSDGWIRLHTNAPHHKLAALKVLGCTGDKVAVADAVASWQKTELEDAIVAENGAAAAMHDMATWAAHPQGKAIVSEPLIDWTEIGADAPPAKLDGLKVLDLTRVLAGPVATRFLAGFGADVLRIDPPWWDEAGVEPEVTLGKRRAGLDLRKNEDRMRFEALLRDADMLIHGYRPGALEGLGYSSDRLRALSPNMIDISLCAYGWTGPWAQRRGFDSLVQMSCGIAAEGMARKGSDQPVPLPVQALDHATGYLMAAAALRALHIRNTSSRVLKARLSLAKTADLLMSKGARNFAGQPIIETDTDLTPTPENTHWGDAKRIHFPVSIDGQGPIWRYPAGPFRVNDPTW
ncbi:MAG: CoA transferase [Pseudomonadota bacterium]